MKLNLKTFIAYLFTFIFVFSISTFAVAPNLTSSELQDLQAYVTNLNRIQNNIYTLAQSVTFPSDSNSSSIDNSANRIRTTLDGLLDDLGDYLDNTPTNTPLYRNLLILQNIVNNMRASLYELEVLHTQDNPVEKLATLEHFFYFRINAIDGLRLFNTFL